MKNDNLLKMKKLLDALKINRSKLSSERLLKRKRETDPLNPISEKGAIYAPFPYFGGKREVALKIWEFFGSNVDNYIEPFAGGLAVLLGRPFPYRVVEDKLIETINDKDAMVINAWRAIKYAEPRELAQKVEIINSQQHLDALKRRMFDNYFLLNRLIRNHDEYYDADLAAIWLVGMRNSIAAGFAVTAGYHRKVSPRVKISGWPLGSPEACFTYLRYRLKRVNLMCGDWFDMIESRTRTTIQGITAIFADPPYPNEDRADCYREDDGSPSDAAADCVIRKVRRDKTKKIKIVFCGYNRLYGKRFDEEGWTAYPWTGRGYGLQGYGQGRANAADETIWFSPFD